jgi:hypothetical protein
MSRGRGRFGFAGGALLAVLAAALLLAPSAGATSFQRPFKEVFGTAQQPSFAWPKIIAIDHATGDVLVGDNNVSAGTLTIYRFHADGTPAPFAALGANAIDGKGSGACSYPPTPSPDCDKTPQSGLTVGNPGPAIAVDESSGPTAGDIYVTQPTGRGGGVDVFSSAGKYLGQLQTGNFSAYSVVVDSGGAVYVSGELHVGSESSFGIRKFVPTANPPVNSDETTFFPVAGYGKFSQIALGAGPSAGWLFIAGDGGVAKFDTQSGEYHSFVEGVNGQIAVDPTTGNPLVAKGLEVLEFDGSAETTSAPLSRTLVDQESLGNGIGGIATDSAGDLDVITGPQHPQVFVFGHPTIVPTVSAGEATEVTGNSATLSGSVNASGVAVEECRFEVLRASEANLRVNELQETTLSGATGGSFKLKFEGQETAPIPYGASAAEVQAALEALPAIGVGNVGVGVRSSGYGIEFKGALAATDVPQLEADGSALTPGGASVAVTTAQQGKGWGNAEVLACEGAIPPDSEVHPVEAKATGLSPNGVEYVFRLAAKNQNGTETRSSSFITAQTVLTDAAEVTGPETAILKGTVRPEGHAYTECFFEWGLADNPGYEHTASCEPEAAAIPADLQGHAVQAALNGLQEATRYRVRIIATNSEGNRAGQELYFQTFGPPQISEVRARDATQSTARIEAKIDPSGFDTSYRFEWGPTESYDTSVPLSPEAIGTTPTKVSAELSGLSTGSAYHYRVVAESSGGRVTQTADQRLEALNSCGLFEARCFEMVSPRVPFPPEQPGRYLGGAELKYQVADQPGALAYINEAGQEGATRGAEILYQGIRGPGEAGWSSSQLAPPITAPDRQTGVTGITSIFLGFSPDLGCAAIGATQPLTEDPVAEAILDAGGANLYRRNPDGTYTLITDRPPEELKRTDQNLIVEFELVGMSEDCSKVVFSTKYHYFGVPSAGAERPYLYEWEEGAGLRSVGFVPKEGGGEGAVEATGGSTGLGLNGDWLNAVSEDGSRVFFSAKRLAGAVSGEVGKTGVFVREDGSMSVDVSASETSTPDEGAGYQGASADGRRVYFTANAGLTSASSEAGTNDLYEYDFEAPAGEKLTDLSATALAGGAGVDNGFTGALVGMADDGSRVYFAARGQLAPGQGPTLAQNKAGKTYSLYERSAAGTRFVGTVGEHAAGEGVTTAVQASQTSRVSPDGRYLLFESSTRVSGYDSGGVAEAYLYDAEAGPGEEATVCVSCRQDGAAPVQTTQPLLSSGGLATNLLYQARSLVVRDGKPLVFFRSHDPLAPGATEGLWNLYEWSHGQVFHIATEDAATPSLDVNGLVTFVGASKEGEDLYFFGDTALNWENPEGRPEVWDARIGGGFAAPPAPPVPCDPSSEGSCSAGPASSAPSLPSAGSATFAGPGNVKQKAAKHKKRHKHRKKHKRVKRHGRQGK